MSRAEADRPRLGPLGIAVAVFVLVALGLSLIYCAFPWGMTKMFAHQLRQIR
jgi:hypothetical protein